MEILQYPAELLSTLAECYVTIGFITAFSGQRFKGWRHGVVITLLVLIQTAYVLFMNSYAIFSYLTIATSFLLTIFTTKLSSKGSWIKRMTSSFVIFFIFTTLDYIIFLAFMAISGDGPDMIQKLSQYNGIRNLYLLINKSLDLIFYLVIRKSLQNFPKIKNSYLVTISAMALIPYLIISYLFASVLEGDIPKMQLAILFSWVIILAFLFLLIYTVYLLTKRQEQEFTNKMLAMTNELMEKNYRQLEQERVNYHRLLHDHSNHLSTLGLLLEDSKTAEAQRYISELLEQNAQLPHLCNSGNHVVDAIINSKAAEAEENIIKLDFQANFGAPTALRGADICAILSNQLDNALEGCCKIETPSERRIDVKVFQKKQFVFFRVRNTVAFDPLRRDAAMTTTKPNAGSLHGYGLQNIRDTAGRYQGHMETSCTDLVFTSLVSIPIEPLDTKATTV